MKNQDLFSSKDKSKILKCRLLQFLFGALRVTIFRPDAHFGVLCKQCRPCCRMQCLIRVNSVHRNFYAKYSKNENIHQIPLKLEMDSSR